MEPALIVKLAAVLSIVLIVLSIGLGSTLGTGVRFLRDNPGQAARAMLAMFVAVPLFVLLVTWLVPLERPVRLALLALAVAPMPPILPRKQTKVGGENDFIAGLLLVAPLVAIVVTPLFIMLAERVYSRDASYDPLVEIKTLVITLAAPLLAGILFNRLAPSTAAKLVRPVGLAGTVLLALAALIILYFSLPAIRDAVGNGTLLTMALVVAFGLIAGYLLGGPEDGNRRALAVATASRHPGVAIAVAAGAFPGDAKPIVAAVLLYLIINALLGIAFTRLTRGSETAAA